MNLKVVKGKDKEILRTVCKPVEKFDKDLKNLAKDMIKVMHASNGIGIAAPQVGIDARIFIGALKADTKNPKELVCVNPEVLYFGDKKVSAEEGCLSLPGVFGNVLRSDEIFVRFYDLKGKEMNLKLTGMDARVFLHELDHLNGVLFIDHLEKPKVF